MSPAKVITGDVARGLVTLLPDDEEAAALKVRPGEVTACGLMVTTCLDKACGNGVSPYNLWWHLSFALFVKSTDWGWYTLL